jgi:hypothetical protein
MDQAAAEFDPASCSSPTFHNRLRVSRQRRARIRITQNRMAHTSEILDETSRHRFLHIEVAVSIRHTE